jgi:hypothetical protein
VRMEASPSQVYGAALLMRFGSDPIRSSNLRASAQQTGSFREAFRALGTAGFCVQSPMHAQSTHRGQRVPRRPFLALGGFWGTMAAAASAALFMISGNNVTYVLSVNDVLLRPSRALMYFVSRPAALARLDAHGADHGTG